MRVPSAELTDVDVLAAVERLSLAYRSPSTSLIVWELSQEHAVGGSFQVAVRDALERLRCRGDVVCVSHRGTRRWHLATTPPG